MKDEFKTKCKKPEERIERSFPDYEAGVLPLNDSGKFPLNRRTRCAHTIPPLQKPPAPAFATDGSDIGAAGRTPFGAAGSGVTAKVTAGDETCTHSLLHGAQALCY